MEFSSRMRGWRRWDYQLACIKNGIPALIACWKIDDISTRWCLDETPSTSAQSDIPENWMEEARRVVFTPTRVGYKHTYK